MCNKRILKYCYNLFKRYQKLQETSLKTRKITMFFKKTAIRYRYGL